MTKIHEEFIRNSLDYVIENLGEPRGEYVIVIEGSNIDKNEIQKENLNKISLEEHYTFYENLGMDKKEIIKQIAKDRNMIKNEIYKYFIKK